VVRAAAWAEWVVWAAWTWTCKLVLRQIKKKPRVRGAFFSLAFDMPTGARTLQSRSVSADKTSGRNGCLDPLPERRLCG